MLSLIKKTLLFIRYQEIFGKIFLGFSLFDKNIETYSFAFAKLNPPEVKIFGSQSSVLNTFIIFKVDGSYIQSWSQYFGNI